MVKLFKNYEEDFEKLREDLIEIKEDTAVVNTAVMNNANDLSLVRKDIRELSKSVEDLSCCIDDLQNAFKELCELSQKADENTGDVEDVIEDDVEELEPVEYLYSGLSIAKTQQKDFHWTGITDAFKFKYTGGRYNQEYVSAYTIFDVLLIMGIEYEKSWKSWRTLGHMTGIKEYIIKEIAYNYKNGFFDGFFGDKPIVTFSKSYGLLYVNGKKTNVPIRTARYIVECITNSSRPMTTLLKLEKTGECSKLMTRLIGTSYKNSNLTSLLYTSDTVVENNPQKRKEKGL